MDVPVRRVLRPRALDRQEDIHVKMLRVRSYDSFADGRVRVHPLQFSVYCNTNFLPFRLRIHGIRREAAPPRAHVAVDIARVRRHGHRAIFTSLRQEDLVVARRRGT